MVIFAFALTATLASSSSYRPSPARGQLRNSYVWLEAAPATIVLLGWVCFLEIFNLLVVLTFRQAFHEEFVSTPTHCYLSLRSMQYLGSVMVLAYLLLDYWRSLPHSQVHRRFRCLFTAFCIVLWWVSFLTIM